MKSKPCAVLLLPFVVLLVSTTLAWGASTDDPPAAPAQPTPDLSGTWTGTLAQKTPDGPSYAVSVSISPDSKGVLWGTTTLDSKCVKNPRLKVRINGSTVALVGSDADGDSLSLKGTLDNTGKVLTMTFTANGSASGRCESIRGTATLQKH